MKSGMLWTIAAVGLLSLAGCNKAETPAQVQHDVAKASDSAAENDAKVKGKADEKVAAADYDTAVTTAEGDHKIALAQCQALSGDAQKACKDKADANLEAAKANAKGEKAQHD